jgi:DNA transposition AAA+ family ATPase
MSNAPGFGQLLVTKEHRRFVEFCDACRRYRYIGLCYGPAGVGKTVSARTYARQDLIEHLLANCHMLDLPVFPEIVECATVFYTPTVVHSQSHLAKDIVTRQKQLSDLHYWMQSAIEKQTIHSLPLGTTEVTELIIVDEADRLNAMGLEQM